MKHSDERFRLAVAQGQRRTTIVIRVTLGPRPMIVSLAIALVALARLLAVM